MAQDYGDDEVKPGLGTHPLSLAILCHEIRTTLNAMMSTVALLREDQPSPSQVARLQILQEAGDSLTSLVDRSLALERIRAGAYPVLRESFDVVELARRLGQLFSATAKESKVQLQVLTEAAPDSSIMLGDPVLLRQALSNLLGNAMRFAPGGQVALEVAAIAEPTWVQLRVRDNGRGMSESQQNQIFQPFCRLASGSLDSYEHSGLGLSFVQGVVQHLGGRIQLKCTGPRNLLYLAATFAASGAKASCLLKPVMHLVLELLLSEGNRWDSSRVVGISLRS